MHCDQFSQFSKSCHICSIRCFLKPSFAQNDSNVLLQSFFTRFRELSFFNQVEHFVKAIALALRPILPIFRKKSFFEYKVFF